MADETITLITEIVMLLSTIVPMFISISRIARGTKCQLRSEMLRIYYKHKDEKKIRQYEFENFMLLYEAYKALRGNSFIDAIYGEVKTWEVVS